MLGYIMRLHVALEDSVGTDHFKQRLLFGTSQAFAKPLEKGAEYKFLQPVYGLGIVAEIYEKTTPEWYHHYQLVKKVMHRTVM